MKLGVDIYTIRSQGWDAFQYLAYCRDLGLEIVHFSDLQPFESTDESYLKRVRARADDLGLQIEARHGSICPTSTTFRIVRGMDAVEQVREMLRVARILGSPVLRCFLGANADRHTELPIEGHIEAAAATCKAVRSLALDLGIKLAIENHAGDLQGWELPRC